MHAIHSLNAKDRVESHAIDNGNDDHLVMRNGIIPITIKDFPV